MSENGCHFVEWKEHFVSQERGNRVVHYFFKDSAGESVLAVVGTERSVRHMFYVVAEEFVRVYGAGNSIHAGFKWRSRREVVDWLTSMLSKQNTEGDWSRAPKCDSEQSLGPSQSPVNGTAGQRTETTDVMGHIPPDISVHNWVIVWSGTAWTCNKQLKHYPAFCRNGTTISAQSFVFVMGKGENRYVAYLEDMYEDKRGQKKVKVRWFHHTQEVKSVIPLRNPHPKEVFITQHAQVISAECVDGPATVLTREHYEECLAFFPKSLLVRVHMCFRQFRINRVKPFDLKKLRGYFAQPILSCLSSTPVLEPDSADHGVCGEDEDPVEGEHVTLGAKRSQRAVGHPENDCQMMSHQSSWKKPRCGLSGERLLSLRQIVKQPWFNTLLKPDAKIELLCQDSGLRGCWFRCTILQVSRKKIKVQYDDIQEEDGYGNLEEWVPVCKSAMPDKLGIRIPNRLTLRPTPPEAQTDRAVTVGTAVDAWWSDGWWEGFVTGINKAGDDNLQVYAPGENLFLTIHKGDIRISRDWVGNRWIDIEPKPDILSLVTVSVSPETKASISSTTVKDIKLDCPAMLSAEIPTDDKPNNVEDEKLHLALSANSGSLQLENDLMNCQRLAYSKEEDNKDGGVVEQLSVSKDDDNENDSNTSDAVDDKGWEVQLKTIRETSQKQGDSGCCIEGNS